MDYDVRFFQTIHNEDLNEVIELENQIKLNFVPNEGLYVDISPFPFWRHRIERVVWNPLGFFLCFFEDLYFEREMKIEWEDVVGHYITDKKNWSISHYEIP